MPITLMTGLPGNGKTLHALTHIKERAERENREVYYHGINECTLPWTEFKADEWPALPDGCIIVIDECQFVFPTKANGSQLPKHYEDLAVHRHRGMDIYLITQHPTLIHNFVRKLVGQHFHSVRKFGFESATVYEWSNTNPAPETASSQKSAISFRWPFNKEAYKWYKSAEVHTVKKKIPAKIFYVGVFVILVIAALAYYVKSKKDAFSSASQVAAVGDAATESGDTSGSGGPVGYLDPVSDVKKYLWERNPRLQGLPETAPRYDMLTAPTRVPVPAMCIQIGDSRSGGSIKCQCYTQQATKLDVEFNMCIDIARNGRFMDFDPEPRRDVDNSAVHMAEMSQARRSADVLDRYPDVPQRENYGAPQVIAFNEVERAPAASQAAPSVIDDGPPVKRAIRYATVPEGGKP